MASRVAARRFLATAAAASVPSRRLADVVSSDLLNDIYNCSLKKQTGVSLKYMMEMFQPRGAIPKERQMVLSAQFLHKELAVRLAHRVAELENLPHGLSTKRPVLKVRDWYVESFKDLRAFANIRDSADEQSFTALLHKIYARHADVVPMMALGVAELKRGLSEAAGGRALGLNDLPEIHQFLDGFYLSRIGIRMLISQHCALHEPQKENHVGLICAKLSPVEVARQAVEDARSICMRQYGSAPTVEIFGDPNFTFAYVPPHLHQMLFEVIKNSLRAVADRYQDSDKEPPPIRIIVAEGNEDITVKVSDEGGGIPRTGMPRIWTYLYSTAASPLPQDESDLQGGGVTVLAGYGYGLPISRLYARYFGGDLQIISMEGYGTDAYLHLNRLGNVQEPLP